jgi:nickel-dependent lactate racemase
VKVDIDYGLERLAAELPDGRLATCRRLPTALPLADPAAAVRQALESPRGFPALRRALTPDDHVVLVVDEHLPHLADLVLAVLEHVRQAHVALSAITILLQPEASGAWVGELPTEYRTLAVEIHDPADRKRLSYLATTREGRRVYLNRTAVDADQLVVLTRRGYDPLLGYSGAVGAIYPALADTATARELAPRLSNGTPGNGAWPVHMEAAEVGWLLGAPFLLQLIEGSGDSIIHVLGGLAETSAEGERLLDARWRVSVRGVVDTVVAGLSGDPARHDFGDLARALACCARVVRPGGRIVLMSEANPQLGRGVELLRQAQDPESAFTLLLKEMPHDLAACFQWAAAAGRASIFLLSNLPAVAIEEMFATPLEHVGQVQRLLGSSGMCLILPDAHKSLAVLES